MSTFCRFLACLVVCFYWERCGGVGGILLHDGEREREREIRA